MPNHNNAPVTQHNEQFDPFTQLENDAGFTSAYDDFNQAAGQLDDQNRTEQENLPSPAEKVDHATDRIEAVLTPTETPIDDEKQAYAHSGARRLKSLTDKGDGILNKIDNLADRFENGETVRDMAKSALKHIGRSAFTAIGGNTLSLAIGNSLAARQAKRAAKTERKAAVARAEETARRQAEASRQALERARAREQAEAGAVYEQAHQMNRDYDRAQAAASYDEATAYNDRFDIETSAYEMNDRYDQETEAYEMNEAFDTIATARTQAKNKARAKRLAKERRKQDRAARKLARSEARTERIQTFLDTSKVVRTGRAIAAYTKGLHAAGMESVRAAETTRANRQAAEVTPATPTPAENREQFFAENAE